MMDSVMDLIFYITIFFYVIVFSAIVSILFSKKNKYRNAIKENVRMQGIAVGTCFLSVILFIVSLYLFVQFDYYIDQVFTNIELATYYQNIGFLDVAQSYLDLADSSSKIGESFLNMIVIIYFLSLFVIGFGYSHIKKQVTIRRA